MSEKPRQMDMFPDLPHAVVAKRVDRRWYYIVSPTNRDMLAFEEGKYVWVEHDPTNLAPHFFSTAPAAHKFMKRQSVKGSVKLWPWQECKPANWKRNLGK